MQGEPSGNRWFKVNLHTHGHGHDPAEFVEHARRAEIDVIAVTDHQSFAAAALIIDAATKPGRPLVVLPEIEITTHEGVHLLAIFPASQTEKEQLAFLGFLEISGKGDTKEASRKGVSDIFAKVHELGGVIVVPHPFTGDIGLLDRARKMNTKVEWLDSGHVQLMQISEDRVAYLGHDARGEWVNRYVLASARPNDIEQSGYCLAPFNRSDAHTPDELPNGCSWFRMEEPTVEGLKQVACEPRTRISKGVPPDSQHDCILGLRVTGGYCDGEFFRFNERLTCIVGQNYAGKSTVLDLVRFACGHDQSLTGEPKTRLLQRLNGILQADGEVELYLRHRGDVHVVTRKFSPVTFGYGASVTVEKVTTDPHTYRLHADGDELDPVDDLDFKFEVYEQGRISRLREDVGRQLEMLDDFAGVVDLKAQRTEVVEALCESAELLAPLYEEREELLSAISGYVTLKKELIEKSALLPASEEEERWARSLGVAGSLEAIVESLEAGIQTLPPSPTTTPPADTGPLETLFSQAVPKISAEDHVQHEILSRWAKPISAALSKIEAARKQLASAVHGLRGSCQPVEVEWTEAAAEHERVLAEQMRKAGVESPQELLSHLKSLRRQVRELEDVKRPRLDSVKEEIRGAEIAREKLLAELADAAQKLTAQRKKKAEELTESLDGKIKVSIRPSADRKTFRSVIESVASRATASGDRRIRNRDEQLDLVAENVTPLQLANALMRGGKLGLDEGVTSSLVEHCGITENTSEILCTVDNDIRLLNELQTTAVPDVPAILVQRQGESEYVGLTDGLSPGEQSSAILSLALGTRSTPLVLDQPEDELGYSYVVHLIVPKILDAKASRQIIIVTHNANIPVLGDADYVIQMRNTPCEERGRRCQVAASGCFEQSEVTNALIELEGGKQAFQLRRNRYRLHR